MYNVTHKTQTGTLLHLLIGVCLRFVFSYHLASAFDFCLCLFHCLWILWRNSAATWLCTEEKNSESVPFLCPPPPSASSWFLIIIIHPPAIITIILNYDTEIYLSSLYIIYIYSSVFHFPSFSLFLSLFSIFIENINSCTSIYIKRRKFLFLIHIHFFYLFIYLYWLLPCCRCCCCAVDADDHEGRWWRWRDCAGLVLLLVMRWGCPKYSFWKKEIWKNCILHYESSIKVYAEWYIWLKWKEEK